MFLYGVEWPEGWEAGEHHTVRVLGPYVTRPVSPKRDFRVRFETLTDQWVAEYVTPISTWDVGSAEAPLVACGLCLLYDTVSADRIDDADADRNFW